MLGRSLLVTAPAGGAARDSCGGREGGQGRFICIASALRHSGEAEAGRSRLWGAFVVWRASLETFLPPGHKKIKDKGVPPTRLIGDKNLTESGKPHPRVSDRLRNSQGEREVFGIVVRPAAGIARCKCL